MNILLDKKLELINEMTSNYISSNKMFLINGHLKNNSSKTISYIQLTFNCLESDTNKIIQAIDLKSNFAVGEIWEFNATAINCKNIVTFNLADVYIK